MTLTPGTFAKYTMFAKTADRDKVPLINRYMGPQNIVNSAGDEWWKRRKVAVSSPTLKIII